MQTHPDYGNQFQAKAEFRSVHIVQPSPMYKINVGKSKTAASYFSIISADWPKWFYSSIQVQLYGSIYWFWEAI